MYRTWPAVLLTLLVASAPTLATARDDGLNTITKLDHEALEQTDNNLLYYESPGTSHEWLTWRRCLHEFVPLLFQPPDIRIAGENDRPVPRSPRRGGFGGPIVLGPDDKPAFDDPPADFKTGP